jgi:hypothetical protein
LPPPPWPPLPTPHTHTLNMIDYVRHQRHPLILFDPRASANKLLTLPIQLPVQHTYVPLSCTAQTPAFK